MNFTYLLILIGSLVYPVYRTFGPPLFFSKSFKYLLPALVIEMVIFIAWDIYFTQSGFWGFNPDYVTGFFIGPLPIEEVLFFLIIPYCCMFIYEVVRHLGEEMTHRFRKVWIHVLLISLFLVVGLMNLEKSYTSWAALYAAGILGLTWMIRPNILGRFYFSYLFVLVPFIVVNGILTGTGVEEPIVWYNNEENLSMRLMTIPVEDLIYCFGMLLTVALPYEIFKSESLDRANPSTPS